MDQRSICLDNGVIYTPTTVIQDGRVLISGGKIQAVGARDAVQAPTGCEIIDADARMILPGFIDVHVHGGGGGDTMDATADSLMRMTAAHARHGTTSICVATMAASDASIEQALG